MPNPACGIVVACKSKKQYYIPDIQGHAFHGSIPVGSNNSEFFTRFFFYFLFLFFVLVIKHTLTSFFVHNHIMPSLNQIFRLLDPAFDSKSVSLTPLKGQCPKIFDTFPGPFYELAKTVSQHFR